MALPKVAEVRELSDTELADEIVAVKKQLFQLRLQKATGRLETTHLFKHTRHRLAQLLTVERERQIAAAKATTETTETTTEEAVATDKEIESKE